MKYVVVTGAVDTGAIKGVTANSIGVFLKTCELHVTSIKLDPYLKTVAGIVLSPFILEDGGNEVDMGLGNYERLLNIKLTPDHNINTGKIQQVMPHVTYTFQEWIERAARVPVDGKEGAADVCVIELGGIIGAIECMLFIKALNQFSCRLGPGNLCLVYVNLHPVSNVVGEETLDENVKEKVSQFCHVPAANIITLYDDSNISDIPSLLRDQKADEAILKVLNLQGFVVKPKLEERTERTEFKNATVGKNKDSYLAVLMKGNSSKSSTQESESRGLHGISVPAVGVSTPADGLSRFHSTPQVREALSQHTKNPPAPRSKAWKEVKPPPKTPQEASRPVIQTGKGRQKADREARNGLPLLHVQVQTRVPVCLSKPERVKFVLQTLPVDPDDVADGDTITVYVDTAEPREASCVPKHVQLAVRKISEACAAKKCGRAIAIHESIVREGYRILPGSNDEDILAKKYRIRLRGIDAPESLMPFGKEAKDMLIKLVHGKCLKIYVYDTDHYGRSVGDIYSNDVFVQETMLKKGLAWHYAAYDNRSELASWEKQAQAAQVGLWAQSNPEKPWEWRKDRRQVDRFHVQSKLSYSFANKSKRK